MEPLDQIPLQKKVKIVAIEGGWGIRQLLTQIGLHVGDELIVVRCGMFGGPLLINIHGAQVAVGRGMAQKVMVNLL